MLGVKEEKEGEDGEPRGSGGCYGRWSPQGDSSCLAPKGSELDRASEASYCLYSKPSKVSKLICVRSRKPL